MFDSLLLLRVNPTIFIKILIGHCGKIKDFDQTCFREKNINARKCFQPLIRFVDVSTGNIFLFGQDPKRSLKWRKEIRSVTALCFGLQFFSLSLPQPLTLAIFLPLSPNLSLTHTFSLYLSLSLSLSFYLILSLSLFSLLSHSLSLFSLSLSLHSTSK